MGQTHFYGEGFNKSEWYGAAFKSAADGENYLNFIENVLPEKWNFYKQEPVQRMNFPIIRRPPSPKDSAIIFTYYLQANIVEETAENQTHLLAV